MTKHDNIRTQRGDGTGDLNEWLDRMMPVLRATVEVELMRKRALGLPISEPRADGGPKGGPLERLKP